MEEVELCWLEVVAGKGRAEGGFLGRVGGVGSKARRAEGVVC